MIYTVTLNPAIDCRVEVKKILAEKTNRAERESFYVGGKGINVSRVLHNLGVPSIALCFVGGFTGEEIKRQCENEGLECEFFKSEGNTRINIKINGENETEINAPGSEISEAEIEKLKDRIKKLKKDDILVLSGSVPQNLSWDIYKDLTEIISKIGTKVIVDCTGEYLTNTLKYHPFLIKPNIHELGDLFKREIKDKSECEKYARELIGMGAENVLVSMGGDGAVLVTGKGEVFFSEAPKGKVKSTVGAGDSMVAGFIAGYLKSENIETALKTAVSAGSATAFSDRFATKAETEKLLEKMK